MTHDEYIIAEFTQLWQICTLEMIINSFWVITSSDPQGFSSLFSICTRVKWMNNLQVHSWRSSSLSRGCTYSSAQYQFIIQEDWHFYLSLAKVKLLDWLLLGARFTIWGFPCFNPAFFTGAGLLSFFCNGAVLFTGFTPLKQLKKKGIIRKVYLTISLLISRAIQGY